MAGEISESERKHREAVLRMLATWLRPMTDEEVVSLLRETDWYKKRAATHDSDNGP